MGRYSTQQEAHNAYLKALKMKSDGKNGKEILKETRTLKRGSKEHKIACAIGRFVAKGRNLPGSSPREAWGFQTNFDNKYIGTYKTELEAYNAYNKAFTEKYGITFEQAYFNYTGKQFIAEERV